MTGNRGGQHGGEFLLGAAGGVAAGLSPGLTYVGDVALGLRGRRYSAELDLRLVGPSSLTVGRGSLEVWQWSVLVAPCAHRGYFAGCLLGSAGMIYGSSAGFVLTEHAQSPQLAGGARAVAEYPLARDRLRLRANLDVTAAVARTHFSVGGDEAWITPRAAVVLGLGLFGAFF